MTVALLDACVLYPPSLRDLLMRLAADEAYYPRWPSEIQSEWVRNVLANKPATSETQLERTRRLMEQVDPDCLVTGYEPHISTLLLPDPNDRHVLAAAIESDAAVIVTYNLSDFPDTALQAYGIRAAHPDLFLSALFDDQSDLFLHVVQKHRASLKNPPKSVEDYITTLRINRLHDIALRLETCRGDI